MSFCEVIAVNSQNQRGWLCNDDLFLDCQRENFNENDHIFIDENHHGSAIVQRRFVPQLDFSNRKVFPSMNSNRSKFDEDLRSELKSLLDCHEYVRQTNHYSERKEQIPMAIRNSRSKF